MPIAFGRESHEGRVKETPLIAGADEDSAEQEPQARLNVNMTPETAETLRRIAKRKNITYTEAVRRAVAVWAFVEDEVKENHRVQSFDPEAGIIRELVLM